MRRRILRAVVTMCAAGAVVGAGTHGERWFRDITQKAGIQHRHSNRSFHNPYAKIMAGYTALGASVAVADFDGDGYDDLFMTDSAETGKNHLYRNNHNLTFSDMAAEAGLADGNSPQNASAAALWFNFNNDGRPDLFVVRFGQSQLYQNLGGCKFREVTLQAGLIRYMNAITAIAFDYDHDG